MPPTQQSLQQQAEDTALKLTALVSSAGAAQLLQHPPSAVLTDQLPLSHCLLALQRLTDVLQHGEQRACHRQVGHKKQHILIN